MNNLKDKNNVSIRNAEVKAMSMLIDRGVSVFDIAKVVHLVQKDYTDNLTIDECVESVESVLRKREVIYAIMTGIELDKMVEEGLVNEPLLSIISNDDPLYGIDEIIPMSIINLYGTIGFTNFGYLDKLKPGIIGELDRDENQVNTFLDDIVAGIAAASASRIAHRDS